ncbi:MAG: hypothetical protein A2Y18_08145 [Clostridiales bacterium GWD2_32_19]|nr:MAG: hypothetical protein A2Y18_08145 [Clostridiales bacterium GWD2_32_19]
MARQARQYSQTGLYHVIFRGVNRQNIFEEEKDFIKFLEIIKNIKKEINMEIYEYFLSLNVI